MTLEKEKNYNFASDSNWVHQQLLSVAGNIAVAYINKNNIERSDIQGLVQEIYSGLSSIKNHAAGRNASLIPAVPISESLTPDHIICLEDGKKLKMIKRHLKAVYNMSVEEYRQRWGLPMDYPAVAPNYAKKRSNLAKVIGLGVNGRRKKAS